MDMGSCYVNSLAPEIAIRYQEKLQLFCDNIDPYSLDQSECSTSVEDLPNITGHQIKSYLMLSKCPYSGRALGDKSATLMADYTDPDRSGWVSKICVKNRDDIAIVLGEVQILETGEFLSPWFVSFPYGYVLCAHCTCTAGINEMCIHIGGLMHRVQTLKEDARLQSGLSPAIPIPDRSVPVPSRLANRSTSEDDIATKILLNFINGKKGLAPIPKPTSSATASRRRIRTKAKPLPKKRRTVQEVPKSPTTDDETVGQRKRRNRVKLYVCGICSAQFPDKESFMSHCQKLHVLPPLASGGPSPTTASKQSLEATLGPENVAVRAMKQLAILMQKDMQPANQTLLAAAAVTNGGLPNPEEENEMVELIPVPDYDEDDEEVLREASSEVEIVPAGVPDIIMGTPIKQETPRKESRHDPDAPIKNAAHQEPAHKKPIVIPTIVQPKAVPMDTFIVTDFKQEPGLDLVDDEPPAKPPAKSTTKTRSKTNKTSPRTPNAVVTRSSAGGSTKITFAPSKPTTRSSQKLIAPVRKSLRSARKNRSF